MISRIELQSKIRDVVASLGDAERIEVCDLKVSGSGSNAEITVLIDWVESNITIDACADFSRDLQDRLDMQDWVPNNYSLIVSSPGIDFPMTEFWQFKKNIGREIEWITDGKNTTGTLIEVTERGTLKLQINDEEIEYQLEDLTGAKVTVKLTDNTNKKRKRARRKRHEA